MGCTDVRGTLLMLESHALLAFCLDAKDRKAMLSPCMLRKIKSSKPQPDLPFSNNAVGV